MAKRDSCTCSRRSFLRGSGLTLAGFGMSSLFPGAFMRHAMAAGAGDERVLFIFLRGGNDGINSVIPHGDPQYNFTNRNILHIPAAQAIDLNGFASLHPAMAPLMDGFNAGDLAVIHRVGYPDSSQSHFTGQRVWENGNPGENQLFEGWLARYIHENTEEFAGLLPAVSVQPETPVLLRGQQVFVNISKPDGTTSLGPKIENIWRDTWGGLDDITAYRPLLAQTGIQALDTADIYQSWNQAAWDPKDPDNPTWSLFPVSDATNPPDAGTPSGLKFSSESYEFFKDLKVCALSLLESTGTTNGTRVAGTQMNGFDLHAQAGSTDGRHAELLSWLAYGLRSLRIALSGAAIDPRAYTAIWDKTDVFTMSEFGRTTRFNGGGGTDHAAASCMWVTGGNVNGGVYNCDAATWPAGVMFGVDGRYLLYRTDFRAIFGEILRDHMGAQAADLDVVFPGYTSDNLVGQELGLL